MSNKTAKTLFMFPPLATEHSRFYQGLLRGVADYTQLGNRLINLGEQAHAFRQFDQVEEVGRLLSNIPIKRYQAIGYYFLAVATNSMGNGDQDESRRLFELVVDTAPDAYKVKAILSLGALAFHKRDFESALYFYQETIRAGKLNASSLLAIKAISVLKAIEGNHGRAVKDLEKILPLIKCAPARVCFDILNSYAVELGEVGCINEARNISQVVINSPFAFAYPEWLETAQELQPASRSFAAIEPSKIGRAKLLHMPEIEQGEPLQSDRPASVVNLQDWKADMGRKKKSDYDSRTYKDKSFEERDRRELLLTLVDIGTNKRMTDDKLYKVIVYMDKVLNEPDQPQEPEDDPGA